MATDNELTNELYTVLYDLNKCCFENMEVKISEDLIMRPAI